MLGRESARGAIRLLRAPRFSQRWQDVDFFVDDLQFRSSPLVACWSGGEVVRTRGDGTQYDELPCLGLQPAGYRSKETAAVCMLHFILLKKLPSLAQLPSPLPEAAARALAAATQFALSPDGLWLPASGEGAWMLLNGSSDARLFSQPQLLAYLDGLSGGAMLAATAKRAAKQERKAHGEKHVTIKDILKGPVRRLPG